MPSFASSDVRDVAPAFSPIEIPADARCVRAGTGRRDGEPLVSPLVQSTTFCREGLASDPPHKYSRESNPSVAELEAVLGDLEGAQALAFATGLAAEACLFQAVLNAGDRVVCARAVYGGTTRALEQVFSRFGVVTEFVDASDIDAIRAALQQPTRLLFLETPANPTLELTDIRAASAAARAVGALVAVDNTFLTPVLQQPLELGADISVISTTKFVEGHSVAPGGALVTRDKELLDELFFVRKCTGGIQTPLHAWLTLQGLKTLPLRIARQSESAARIAEWLHGQTQVARVAYPGLATGEQARLAAAQHRGAHGAVVSFELNGGYEQAVRFASAIRGIRLVEHVGAVETLLTHSASMTHGGVSPEARRAAGIDEGLLRLSVGLEGVDGLLEELHDALVASEAPTALVAGGVA